MLTSLFATAPVSQFKMRASSRISNRRRPLTTNQSPSRPAVLRRCGTACTTSRWGMSAPECGVLGAVNVTTSAGCDWTATSNASFITVLPPASGSGAGSITYGVGTNNGANPRTGTLTVAGQTFTLTQDGFSVNFDPAQLRFVSAVAGKDASGATLNVNSSQAANGRLGLSLALPAGQTIQPGQRQILAINFAVSAEGESTTATIGFGDLPVARELSDANANSLPVNFNGGAVTLTAPSRKRKRFSRKLCAATQKVT